MEVARTCSGTFGLWFFRLVYGSYVRCGNFAGLPASQRPGGFRWVQYEIPPHVHTATPPVQMVCFSWARTRARACVKRVGNDCCLSLATISATKRLLYI